MDAMRETIEEIVASPVPVVTFVAPSGGRAASAGFFILESGDVAAMAPGTNTGAAHPVLMTGEMDALMKQKVENDAAAEMRSITTKRGRNSALAETAVRQSKSFTEKRRWTITSSIWSRRYERPAGRARWPHGDALRRPHGDAHTRGATSRSTRGPGGSASSPPSPIPTSRWCCW
jgi:hypothetical protein